MTATTEATRHRAVPDPVSFGSTINFDELIPGYPMPRWQRGKYDRRNMKRTKMPKTPLLKRISGKIKTTSLRVFGRPGANLMARSTR